MNRMVIALLLMGVPAPLLVAQEAGSLAERVAAVTAEYDAASDVFREHLREAKTAEERRAVFREKRPDPAAYAPRLLALAQEDPADPAALEAAGWIVQRAGRSDSVGAALDVLEEHHLQDPGLLPLVRSLAYSRSERALAFLEMVAEKSPDHDTRGWALFARGLALKRDGQSSEAEALFKRVLDDYAEVSWYRERTIGDGAEGNLYEMRNLAVGMKAPDIEGEDIDGVPFRLSDYRGKVVMLDFWGHW